MAAIVTGISQSDRESLARKLREMAEAVSRGEVSGLVTAYAIGVDRHVVHAATPADGVVLGEIVHRTMSERMFL